jgi:hypothetical protein
MTEYDLAPRHTKEASCGPAVFFSLSSSPVALTTRALLAACVWTIHRFRRTSSPIDWHPEADISTKWDFK